jgi:putative transposase
MQRHPTYPSDLTDCDWDAVQDHLTPPACTGRPRKVDFRAVVNAICYQNRTGCQWRFLPKDYPPRRTVFPWYRCWQRDGTWTKLLTALREAARQAEGKAATPSVLILDRQTVKAAPGEAARGDDGGKKIVGRKRHIAVDTLGLLLAVVVTAASTDDAAAAPAVLAKVPPSAFPRLTTIFADSKYPNYALLDTLIEDGPPSELKTVHRPEEAVGFVVLEKRWVVERTFAWLVNFPALGQGL